MEGFMNMLTLFVLIAVVAVIVSLVFGVSSMATDGEIGHQTSAKWMTWRVVFQAAALALIMLAILGPHNSAH
jgi:hypothetical protein